MGQRSQIYIRYSVDDGRIYTGFIARYFQWNFAERMISRATDIIETIATMNQHKYLWRDITKLVRICDVNFDMRDIQISTNILQEISAGEYELSYLFEQDANDGQLLIEVIDDCIKYAFIEGPSNPKPMSARTYMKWDTGTDWTNNQSVWPKETVRYTQKNIRRIQRKASLMTKNEVNEFLSADYSDFINRIKEKNQ